MNCRHCNAVLNEKFLDLGFAPPSNAYLVESDLNKSETYYPLRVMVCLQCWLVQTEDYASAEDLFTNDYAYFSSISDSWLNHSRNYVDLICNKLDLSCSSFVVEVGSNDGYLLKNFVSKNIPCLGVEPTLSSACIAREQGIDVLGDFFSKSIADKILASHGNADLVLANNVYGHVPDINDFTEALKILIKPDGIITIEFPHLLELIKGFQFDTVYHEHFSYLSLTTVSVIFQKAKLKVWDVERIPTHGGSLRIYGTHAENKIKQSIRVKEILDEEFIFGLNKLSTYVRFQENVNRIKNNLLRFLLEVKSKDMRVVGYGAAAKGNTLLNYAGVGTDLLPCIYDASRVKHGKLTPGAHIPILPLSEMIDDPADYVLVLPWNLSEEIKTSVQKICKGNPRFVRSIPDLAEF